jgi:hypothetical protein
VDDQARGVGVASGVGLASGVGVGVSVGVGLGVAVGVGLGCPGSSGISVGLGVGVGWPGSSGGGVRLACAIAAPDKVVAIAPARINPRFMLNSSPVLSEWTNPPHGSAFPEFGRMGPDVPEFRRPEQAAASRAP